MDSKDIKDMWKISGPYGRNLLIVAVIAIFVVAVFAYLNIQDNIQDTKLINNLSEMIKDQKKEDILKKCILEEYNDANDYFNRELLTSFGKILSDNGILFPQEINIKIQNFRSELEDVKDCLISPGDL